MIIHVANPIYDAVFKYLMEDERIAKTLLSALLKKKVLTVQSRRHEYTNGTRDKVSMFRIDFAAQVLQDDGTAKLVLIELQKTWLDTETLRFRQYLGAHYSNPENITKDDNPDGFATPMIAVYLLGHRVGDIEEPVLYVNHKSYNYEGQEVTKGIPDPFVESLVHNSIIIQIPLLHGQVNNRLEKVLSVFDQSRKDKHNRQVLNIDEDLYADDEEMIYILHRLTSAAANAKMRQDMNVEDEYFSAIEKRDTEIMVRDKRIEEQEIKLAEQDYKLAEQDYKLAEQDHKLAEQDHKLAEQDYKLAEQDYKLAEQDYKLAEQDHKLAENELKIAEQDHKLAEKESQIRTLVTALAGKGLSCEEIAALTGCKTEDIKLML